MMCFMFPVSEIDPGKVYSTTEVAAIVGLSYQHVARLVHAGQFPGSHRKAPVSGSPLQIPGSAVIQFIEKRNLK